VTIEGGVARVDFGSALAREVAGSCRVLAIRSQITATLMQFDTVARVEILIEGSSQGVLQP
jgi:spore germination protein GerM